MTNETVVAIVNFRLGEIGEELASAKSRLRSAEKHANELRSEVDTLTAGEKDLREWLEANKGPTP